MTTTAAPVQRTAGMTGRVLIVDDHAAARESMAETLIQAGHRAVCVSSAMEALNRLEEESFDVVLSDLQMPGMTGLEFIREHQRRGHGAQVVLVTAYGTVQSAVEAMRLGALDYIEKPFDADQLEELVARAVRRGRLLDESGPIVRAADATEPVTMIGSSRPMQELRAQIARAAPTNETVLISGESGTGKELVARAIHAASQRAAASLISLNCPVLSAHLLESELFGHERGAFTGADAPRTGRFELADGGTILLDEVTEIDLPLQAKLLRVLQEKAFERVGSSRTQRVDVRVLATTNRDLPAEIAVGRFREDLYYRLAVVPLVVPPLRERGDDVGELIDHCLNRAAKRLGREPCPLEPPARDLLLGYSWPGNVRELENVITRASVLNQGRAIRADEIRPWLIAAQPGPAERAEPEATVGLSLEEMERKLIESTFEHFGGHRAKTAEALGIGLRTLSGKLKAYGYAPRSKPASRAA